MGDEQKPSVGRIVHYRALGSADGRFPVGECRAAVITAVIEKDDNGKPLENVVSLCILNPTGMYFNDVVFFSKEETGGTWHWPERV